MTKREKLDKYENDKDQESIIDIYVFLYIEFQT